jgi:hypothetical protein
MPIRLLTAVILFALCASQALAQSQKESSKPVSVPSANFLDNSGDEPFTLDFRSGDDAVTRSAVADEQQLPTDGSWTKQGESAISIPGRDKSCYSIRSYVVKRDGPQTDSTHPVSYSTCVPARNLQQFMTVERHR